MVKVKEFHDKWESVEGDEAKSRYVTVDKVINEFLEKNKNIKVIDIKYSPVMYLHNELKTYALLIYEEKE